MKIRPLGKTGLEVTELCTGLLPMGPAHLDLPGDNCVAIIRAARKLGVNFFDTAKGYRTQPFLKEALGDETGAVVIATKSPAADSDTMARDVEESLKQTGRDCLDIYHLHAAVEPDPFTNRAGALKRLLEFKEQGIIRAVGVATHHVRVVNDAAERDDIDVVFPLINLTGMGISDGTREDMQAAIHRAATVGKGIYAMKPFAGGNLLDRFREAVDYMRAIEGVSSVAMGVVSEEELAFDVRVFNDEEISEDEYRSQAKRPKKMIVIGRCRACGVCVKACSAGAIHIENKKAVITAERCILCGYCALECPEFCIRSV